MHKEEYFRTKWKSDLDSRTVDGYGREFYYSTTPIFGSVETAKKRAGYWYQKYEQGEKYDPEDVADWWHESLQTKEQYLQLQNQANA